MGFALPPNTTAMARRVADVAVAGLLFVTPPACAAPISANVSSTPLTAKDISVVRSTRKSRTSISDSFDNWQPKITLEVDKNTTPKTIPTPKAKVVENTEVKSFYHKVERLMKNFGLNKSQLSAVLNVQRKSVYDWKSNPEVEVRAATRTRVQILERFAASMDNGHAMFLGKLAFGSLGHNDLAIAMTQETLNLAQLQTLYDNYWLEFDGMYKRAKLREATKDFSNESSTEELFISV